LGTISGEKPRVYEEPEDVIEEELEKFDQQDAPVLKKKLSKDMGKIKARKGVGYSARQGETFDVAAYLEKGKDRNK
jgi:hypothetical protein